MAAPTPDWEFYSESHHGVMERDEFDAALPEAMARLSALAGEDVPGHLESRYKHAACALCDRVGGADLTGMLASQTVGDTSLTYAEAAQTGGSDYDAASAWLAGTGLLCRAVCVRGCGCR